MGSFTSDADNLVAGDTNGVADLFLRDRAGGTTVRVAENTWGLLPAISANGRYVGFRGQPGTGEFSVYDRISATTSTWTDTDVFGSATAPLVSADGTAAVYGIPTSFGLFSTACRVRDLVSGVTTECPSGTGGSGVGVWGAASANARFIVYAYNNFDPGVPGWRVLDRNSGTVEILPADFAPPFGLTSISDDGRYLTTHVTDPVSSQMMVARFDRTTGSTTAVPVAANSALLASSISPNGRYIGLVSDATDLVPNDTNGVTDVFVWDTSTGLVRLASRDESGAVGAYPSSVCGSGPAQVLSDGTTCVVSGNAFIARDTNAAIDLYRR